jgi:hypothetical protein
VWAECGVVHIVTTVLMAMRHAVPNGTLTFVASARRSVQESRRLHGATASRLAPSRDPTSDVMAAARDPQLYRHVIILGHSPFFHILPSFRRFSADPLRLLSFILLLSLSPSAVHPSSSLVHPFYSYSSQSSYHLYVFFLSVMINQIVACTGLEVLPSCE